MPPACIGEILPKQVGLDRGERRAVGVDDDADRGLGITRIPGPAADFLAARLFVAAFVGVRTPCRSRLRITAGETPGKEQEAEADALERRDDPGSPPQAAVSPQLAARVPATEGLIRREQDTVVQAVKHVVRRRAVPEAHEPECKEESEIGRQVAALEPPALLRRHDETHVHVIAQPPRQRDVPAVPEVANVRRQERAIEILRRVNAEQIAEADGEGAVAGEVEEQMKAVGVHVREHARPTPLGCGYIQPILPDQGCNDETVEEPGENTVQGSVQVLEEFLSGAAVFPIGVETTIAIDGTRRHRRKEEQVGQELGRRQRRDQPVLDAEDDVEAPKRHVRDAQEAEPQVRSNERHILRRNQRQECEKQRRVERPAAGPRAQA